MSTLPRHDPQSLQDKVDQAQARFRLPPGAREIILVRHGSTVQQDDRFDYEGKSLTDPPLGPEGQRQAEAVAARLKDERITHIFITVLKRTRQTAAPLAALTGLQPALIPELREVYLGDWEHDVHMRAGDPVFQRAFDEENWGVIPSAEPNEELTARVRIGIGKIVATLEPNSVAVAFSHAATIAQICHLATGSRPFAFLPPENTSLSRLVIHHDGRWTLRCFNDVSHLTQ